ncbi:MAG: thioredoxin family protein [Coleofasciculus sp. C1-SOL-03]|jgi:peroxiredoxin|uniref:thioredoxin family protein n=1 Tax=Coleofasciculus sp. C1-SOL-03 TaxID=3069522 RepID=UPI0032FE0A80
MSLKEKHGTSIGSYAPDFELLGTDKDVHHLSRYLEKWRGVVVIFLSNNCPDSAAYVDRLKQLQTRFREQGFILIGINSNDANQSPEDSFSQMQQFASSRGLNFPYLWDPTQDVAQGFGASKTPEAFVIDGQGVLRYRGQIDDNSQDPETVNKAYVKNAIAALLAGEPISPKSTPTLGSPLVWRR